MNIKELKEFVQEIVKKSSDLKDKYTSEKKAPVNYACIFCQNEEQYNNLVKITQELGSVVKETPTGPVFHIQGIATVAGKLQFLKIRKPDSTRPELGDADFTVSDYPEFKKRYLSQKGFKLIVREDFEMIELVDPQFNVRVDFSNPTLEKQLNLILEIILTNHYVITIMPESVLKKAGNFMKDSALLLRPLHKREKWDIGRLDTYLSPQEYKKVKRDLKRGKVKVELIKLGFSFLISGMDVLPRLVSEEDSFQELNNKIETQYYTHLFDEFSPRAYDVLFHYLASDTMYLADLKRAAILQLFSEFPLHILIIGESDSGKSKILNSVRTLAPKATYGIGSSMSTSGLTLSAQGKNVKLGLLPKADQGVSCISELNLVKRGDLSQLLSVMETGFVKYDKGGNSIKENARSRVLASSEPKTGNFKSYTPSQIKKQIPFNPAFLSKFHLIFITKKPNKNEFRIIADTIINESVKKEISDDEIEFIQRYIDYSSGIRVKLPRKLAKQVEEFVNGLKDIEKKLPYDISSKTVEGLVSLIKASARCELRVEVEDKDLERIFSIVRGALQI